ncbi:MAG: hypothetical protein AB1750_09840 [Chloroflexota bacterium]
MPTLELTPEEIQLPEEMLEFDLSDLRMEIVGTDRLEFKSALKHRKEAMLDLLKKLRLVEKAPVAA